MRGLSVARGWVGSGDRWAACWRESVGRGCSPKSVALASALRDRVFEAGVADRDVDRGGAGVGAAGQAATGSDVAGVGRVSADGVAQHVRRAAVLREAGALRVASDGAGDAARGRRSRRGPVFRPDWEAVLTPVLDAMP